MQTLSNALYRSRKTAQKKKIIFIDEIIDAAKDQFSKDVRANGKKETPVDSYLQFA